MTVAVVFTATVVQASDDEKINICMLDSMSLDTHNIITYCVYGKIVVMFQNEAGTGESRYISTQKLDVKCSCK